MNKEESDMHGYILLLIDIYLKFEYIKTAHMLKT
jgi:hypothetical protein